MGPVHLFGGGGTQIFTRFARNNHRANVHTHTQARRHGGGGGGGGKCLPMISFFFLFFFFFFLSAQRSVMAMMIIPYPIMIIFFFFWGGGGNLKSGKKWAHAAVARHFAPPKQTPWRRPCSHIHFHTRSHGYNTF